MSLFHVIDGAQVVLQGKRGVYKQVKLYQRDNELYAAYSGGFIRLKKGNNTTHPDVRWEVIDDAAYTEQLGIRGSLIYTAGSGKLRAAA